MTNFKLKNYEFKQTNFMEVSWRKLSNLEYKFDANTKKNQAS